MMVPVTLTDLLHSGLCTRVQDGLEISVASTWAVSGERRLSHTSQIALVECTREYHWQRDVLTVGVGALDSITRALAASFERPIALGSRIKIRYRIRKVGAKSYSLQFAAHETTEPSLVLSVFDMVSVFYDPVKGLPCLPPTPVLQHLQKLTQT